MSYTIMNIRNDNAKNQGPIVYWLAASGFVFKFASGDIVCIDPYLSDAVEEEFGLVRLSLAPISALNLNFDYLLLTHDHLDHLDTGCFEELMTANPKNSILASDSCADYLNNNHTSFTSAVVGDHFQAGEVDVEVVKADHGEGCPTAVGFVMSYKNDCIYFTGDTCLNLDAIKPAIERKPNIVIPCINGEFGNLSEKDAAEVVKLCEAKIAIPSHFGLTAEHGGNPGLFIKEVEATSLNTRVQLLTPGKGVELL